MSFYNCKEFGVYKHNALIMTEEASKDEKNSIVKESTQSGKVLLLVKAFGRGTDFQVKDKIVKTNGGPHMIQTFLSEQKSEEVQIMGRTARQGGHGSYSMVLIGKELEKYEITQAEINAENEKKTSEL